MAGRDSRAFVYEGSGWFWGQCAQFVTLGLRVPLIAQAGLTEEVRLRVRDGGILIEPATPCRSGWAEAAQKMHERNEDSLIEPPTPTHFDETEWEW